MSTDQVEFRVTRDEALVLFELANRFTEHESLDIRHPAEQVAIWNLCATLESVLTEPLDPSYSQLLSLARDRLSRGSTKR